MDEKLVKVHPYGINITRPLLQSLKILMIYCHEYPKV